MGQEKTRIAHFLSLIWRDINDRLSVTRARIVPLRNFVEKLIWIAHACMLA